jgi:signal transduction histidine kinase
MTATVDAAVAPDRSGEGPLVGGGVRVAAHLVLFASLATAIASLALWASIQPPWTEDQWFFVVDVADAVVYGVVAWLLLTRSRHPVAWLVALTAVGGGLAALGSQWMQYHLAHPGTPELELLSFMQNFGWVPGTLALFTIVPFLVRDEPLSIRSKVGIGAGIVLIGAFMVSRLTYPGLGPDGDPFAPLPIRSDWWASLLDDAFPWMIGALVVLGLLATADVTRRWLRRPRDRRRGLGWLAIGTGILALSFLPLALPASLAEHLPLAVTPVTHLLSQAFFPGAILVVVLGQRLWGIDLAVSRMLVWSLMTAVLTVAYVAVVTALTTLLPVQDGLLQVVSTAFVAAGFQPAKLWVQGKVDRLVHGDAGEPLRVVRRVGRRIGGGAAQGLLEDVATGVQGALRLGGVEVVAADGTVLCSVGHPVAPAGDAGDGGEARDTVEVPLLVHQVEVGRLLARPRPGERLDGRSTSSLEELAPIVAATVELSSATSALAESRARIAAARDEERRALRRELHDGLGPALAGVGLTLRAGSNLLDASPEQARDLVDRAANELDRRVEEVRGMARGLLPPVLDELGLLPALRDLAERHRATGLRVEVHTGAVPELAPEAAVGVYGIVSEAVRNVVRHSGAGGCEIDLTVDAEAGELVVAVTDDGAGIDPAATPGVGLSSMRERAEGLHGSLEVLRLEPNGTRVTARVPIDQEAP